MCFLSFDHIGRYDHIGSLVIYDTFEFLNVSISGNKAEVNVTADIAKSGYTPISFTFYTGSTNVVGCMEKANTSYYVMIRDLVNATSITNFKLLVAYIKNA